MLRKRLFPKYRLTLKLMCPNISATILALHFARGRAPFFRGVPRREYPNANEEKGKEEETLSEGETS